MTSDETVAPILLVEDDETLGNLLARHLRAHGYQVVIAGSTEETIDALERGLRPSLVLLDINLPGETGWSVLRNPAFEAAGRPPVVVASAMAVSPARLREFGVAGYLPKPFALDTLRSTIDRVVDHGDPRNHDRPTDRPDPDRLYRCLLGVPAALRAGRAMNILELVAGLAAAFVFVYLLWALLRPEDF